MVGAHIMTMAAIEEKTLMPGKIFPVVNSGLRCGICQSTQSGANYLLVPYSFNGAEGSNCAGKEGHGSSLKPPWLLTVAGAGLQGFWRRALGLALLPLRIVFIQVHSVHAIRGAARVTSLGTKW